LPDGRTVEFPDEVPKDKAAEVIRQQFPQFAPQTTIGGQVKEAFKGLVPGAVGLLESAATGASALLPEDMEKAAREKIASVAGAAKAPFAAAPGYEESVARKLSEAVGSTAPFLLAGPLGLAGRAAAVGLGVGAGAGEARTRAEREGATADQRGTATALGTIPGALEAFPPFAILSRIPTAAKSAGVEMVKRALVAGGEEAAQEAASNFAQNLIAKGVYKPDQALIEGLGESAAYGGATGAIVQGLMDLALGRRAKGTQTTQPPAVPPAVPPVAPPVAPTTAPAGTQGEMFTPAEMGVGKAPAATAATPPAAEPAATTPEGQMDLGLDFQREVEQLYLERERLKQQAQTPEVKARVADLSNQIRSYEEMSFAERQAQAEADAERARQDRAGAQKFPALAGAPDLLTLSDEVKARTQGDLFGGEPAPLPPTTEAAAEPGAPTPVPPYQRTGPYQYKLPLRGGEAVTPFTMQDVENTGIAPSTTRGWFEQNVVGKTTAEVQQLVDKDPSLIEGKGKRAKILRELLAPQAAPFAEEKPSAKTRPEKPAPEQRNEPRVGEPSVGVPSEPAGAVVPKPGARVARPAKAPATPVGRGLVPAGQPAVPGVEAQGVEPAAVEDEEAQRQREAAEMAAALARQQGRAGRDRVAPPRAEVAPTAQQTQPIPEKLYEPIGTSEIGMEEGQKEILRGPQAMLFPMSKREEIEYAERPREEPAAEEAAAPEAAKDERQGELSFSFEEKPTEEVAPAATPTPSDEATLKAIAGKPMLDVAQWAADNLPDPDQKVIARRVLVKLRQLEAAGVNLLPVEVTPEGRRLIGARGATSLRRDRKTGKPTTLKITLNHPSNGASTGTNPETILHELLHAATLGTIELGKYKSAEGTKVGTATRELLALANAVVQHFNARAVNGQAGLTDFEKKVFARANNALADEHEILVWALSNREMQQYMESIPYKGQTAWDKFTTFVRDLLGIPAKADTALSEALRVGGKLLDLTAEDIRGVERQTGKKLAKAAPEIKPVDPNSAEFKRWFGDSKVKDGGQPMVVYTGTSKDVDFNKFKVPRNGAWFTTDPAAASQYAVENDSMGFKWEGGRPVEVNTAARVIPAYLKIEKPYTLTDEEYNKLSRSPNYKKAQSEVFDSVRARGYDGIDWGGGIWVALKVPSQIKSALGNTGAYSDEDTRIQFQVSASTESLIDSMGPLDPDQKTGLKALIPSFKASMSPAEPNYATKFRTQTADAAATIEHRLREQFDGAVRDSLGKLNPMGLYRQAQDYTKTLLEFFQVGGLVKDPATGLWVVQGKEGVRPPAEVYSLIDAWGAKNGYDRDRATQIASRILEGVRLDAMRTANKTQNTSFLLHLKDPEIDQLVREYNADPDLQAMSKAMDESRLAMVDNMVAVGRLTPEQGAEWKAVAGYVPFDRIDDFASGFNKIKKVSNKGLAQVGKLPELVGSLNRPVGNVFDNYLNTMGWMVGQTMKTDGTVQTLRSLEDLGYAKFLGRSTQQKENTVGGYVGGEMMYWELPSKYDVLAFKDLNPPKAGWLRNLGKFSNVLRKSVTALPPFALKQVTDDVQRAIMTSGVKNPGALLRMSLSNFGGLALAELRGIQHPSVREFGRLGLTGEYDFESGKPAVSLLKDLGYKKRGKFETLMHRLDGITRASDLAVRKAIYDQTMKETNDALLAQTRAREFINFRRRGASDFVGAMVTTIPFFNAYIQGMDVLYRAASGKDSSSSVGRAQARKFFWSRAATVMMLSSLYALGAGDDEDYQEMDLRTRDSNWILPGGFKLPVPTELGALFKVVPERVVEYMRRQGTPEEQTAWEATRTALSYMFEQYVGRTVPVPQAVKPLLEAWTNYSFFTGRELEGIYQKQQDPSMRRASNTSELAIAIANFARDVVGVDKVSPILVDNALNGYFGSTAGLLVAMTDSLLNPTRVDRPLHKWALVSNYMYDPVGTRRMTEFYEEREKVGRANATLNELLKTDLDRAAEYAEKNADLLMLESGINSTLEQLERTRAYRKYLNSPMGAEDMPKEEREAELQELRKMEVELTGWLREAKAAIR
jgi:hypothetical protein